ncbi:hypothetical protein C0J52_16345 [Blattella germanica]|nr:hypothetical protein C0J52_16345 [Blattella germanica]
MESEKSAKKEKVEDTSSSAYETADPEAQAGSSTVEPNVVPEATKTEHVAVTVEVHEEQASTMKPAIAPKAKHVAGSDERSGEQGATSIVTQSDVSDISEAEHVAISIEVSAQEEAKALPVPVNPKFPRGPHKLTMLERYPVGRRFPSRTPKGDIIDVVFVADKESKSLASKLVDKGFPIAPHNSPAESSRNTPPDSETTSLQGDVDPTVEQTEETVLGVKIPHRHVDMATFKIIFLGDVGVGKTSLVMRFCDGVFLNNYYKTTIGVDFKMRMLKLPEVTCRLHNQFRLAVMENVDVKSEKSSEDVKETSTTPDASDPGSQSDSVTVQETVVSDAPEAEQVAIPAEATERAEDNAPDSEAVSADSVAMTEEMLQSSSSAASDDQLPDDNSTEPAVSADATEVSNVASGILSGFGVRFPRKPHNSPAESNSSTSDSGCATPEVSYGDGATTDNTEAGAAAAKPKSMGITVEDLSINAKVFKIIFLGDVGVGKTSIISRFCDGIFFHNYYKTTIGVDFRFRTMHLTENVSVRLHLYDLAGRECKTDLAKVYYRNSNGACIVFDESSTRDLRSMVAIPRFRDEGVVTIPGIADPRIFNPYNYRYHYPEVLGDPSTFVELPPVPAPPLTEQVIISVGVPGVETDKRVGKPVAVPDAPLTDQVEITVGVPRAAPPKSREYHSDMPQTIYSNTNGAVIVFDESSTRDLSGVERWKKQLDDIVILPDGNPIPCILLGNKSDINSRLIDRRTLDNFVTTNNFLKFFRTSAKTGIGIYEAMSRREYYSDMPQTIYSNTNGAVIVFDESSTRDLSGVERWKKQLDDIVILPDGNPIPCILLGNKSDINSRLIDRRTLDNFVTTNNFLKFFRTSAKTGIGIYEAMVYLVEKDVKETSITSEKTSDLGAQAAPSTLQPDKTSDLGAKSGTSTPQPDETSDLGAQAGPSTPQPDKTSDLGALAAPSTLQPDVTSDLGAQAGPSTPQPDKTSDLGAQAAPSTLQPDVTSDLGAQAGPSTPQPDKTSDLGAPAGPTTIQPDKTSDLGEQASASTLKTRIYFDPVALGDPRAFNPDRYFYPEAQGEPSTFQPTLVNNPPLTEQVIISVGVPEVKADERTGEPVEFPDAPLTDQAVISVEVPAAVPAASPPESTMEITVVRNMPVTEHVTIPAVVPAQSETVLSVDAQHLNVAFLGDVGVGKTSIVARFCDGVFFNNYYKTTNGVDHRFRTLHLPDNYLVRLQINDVAGRECSFNPNESKAYYRDSNGAVIVFDESSTSDLSGVERWKKQLDEVVILPDGNTIPCILLGNKSDIAHRIIDKRTLDNFVTTNNFLKYFQTSAKTGIGIYEAMVYLVEKNNVNETSSEPDQTSDPAAPAGPSCVEATVVPDAPITQQVETSAEVPAQAEAKALSLPAQEVAGTSGDTEQLQESKATSGDAEQMQESKATSEDQPKLTQTSSTEELGTSSTESSKHPGTSSSVSPSAETSEGQAGAKGGVEPVLVASVPSAKQPIIDSIQENIDRSTLTFKIIFLGDVGVGKTSIIYRLVDDVFIAGYYKPTIGMDFKIKNMRISGNESIRLHLYDLAGRESFSDLARVYYRRANGAVIVFDKSSTTDFSNVIAWKRQLDDIVSLSDGRPIPCVLLGNKCDLVTRTIVSEDTITNFAETCQFSKFFETSAKESIGIKEAILHLIEKMKITLPLQQGQQSAIAVVEEDYAARNCKCSH